jgi:phage terminase large subunit GpA-like protein
MMFAAQLGKTEVGLNWIGYVMDQAPGPMLTVVPTLEVRKRWVKQRLDPLLLETPVLKKSFDGKRSRDSSNAEDMKDFPGGILVIGGANSPASLASMPIKYVLCDEVDRFPWDVGGEGDPLGLIDERTKTYPRRKVLLVSTPTIKGMSRIEMEYEVSDMREYHVPCPECGEYQMLKWKRKDGSFGLVYSESTGRVWYACEHCGAMIDEHHKTFMLEKGRWVPRFPDRPIRGYRLSGLYSPIGLGFTWQELWNQWKSAHRDTTNLKRFINTTLGESWEEQGEDLENISLLMRRENYSEETIPASAALIVFGADVQKDRIEFTVAAYQSDEEAWFLDHVIVDGDTASIDVWNDFEDELRERKVQFGCIDAGYNTSFVHDFCKSRLWCIPTKGVEGAGRPLIEDEQKRKQRLRKRNRRGFASEPIGVDQGKAIIYSRLKMATPGPGYIHFPETNAFDDEYFAQLGAEKLVTEIKGGKPHQVWKRKRARNEALDCGLLTLVAARLSGRLQKAVATEAPKESKTVHDSQPKNPLGYALSQRKSRTHR